MKKRFKDAIRSVGGRARPAEDEAQHFAASIQPAGFDGDGHGANGTGVLKSYKIFAEYNETTQNLREGDTIIFDECAYIIKSISPSFYGGNPVYLSGMLTLCEEGTV